MSPILRVLLTSFVGFYRLAALLLVLAGVGSTGCGDSTAMGRSCDAKADAGQFQVAYSGEAPECQGGFCLKPVNQSLLPVDTGPYCSTTCSNDGDCDGQTRDRTNPDDKRCENGYACGVAFVVGPLCCAKLCLCKDFLAGPLQTPAPCDPKQNNGRTACLE